MITMLRVLEHLLRTQALANRWLLRGENWLEGLALGALDHDERRLLTDRLYSYWRPAPDYAGGLFDWEQRWFEADLPIQPARVLIGGVGSGRELAWFETRRDRIVAFEPVSELLELARAASQSRQTTLLAGGYEELIADRRRELLDGWRPEPPGTLGANPTPLARVVAENAPYDAVVLGWGSFTHVVETSVRLALLRRARELCPRGPLLTSFWMRPADSVFDRGTSFSLGASLGDWLRRLRDRPQTEIENGDHFVPALGFGHRFSASEFAQLAETSDYRIIRAPRAGGGYPHATLSPKIE
ncbi:MAG: hypothetical protein KC609_00610 [Myxococcales bacterium]|nr:hypothetical protein [Myxococcales bacterium]